MSGSQNNDVKRQFLLERLLDAVNQCQMRFGGRKEIALDSNSRAGVLVLREGGPQQARVAALLLPAPHHLPRGPWLGLAALHPQRTLGGALPAHAPGQSRQAQRDRNRSCPGPLTNFHISSAQILNFEVSYNTFCEDWSFVMDEQRSSMLPTMAAGLNSIRFANNIDNKDLNGQSKFAPTVSDLLKESTQNVTSLLKESTQGGSNLFREIMASSAVSSLIRPEQETDPLLVVSKHVTADARYKKEQNKKKKVTNIISFDDEEDEQNSGKVFKKIPGAGESLEENSDLSSVNIMSAFESPFGPNSNRSQSSNSWKIDSLSLNVEFGYQKLDVKSIDDEDMDENEDDVYGPLRVP